MRRMFRVQDGTAESPVPVPISALPQQSRRRQVPAQNFQPPFAHSQSLRQLCHAPAEISNRRKEIQIQGSQQNSREAIRRDEVAEFVEGSRRPDSVHVKMVANRSSGNGAWRATAR